MRPLPKTSPAAALAALALLAALPGAASAAPAAVPQLNASFVMSPAEPSAGETVRFANTTTGAVGPVTAAWDLDGDGEYDDAVGDTPSRAFSAGTHTVRMRATAAAVTQIGYASKTFTVAGAPEPSTPQPPTTTTPDPPSAPPATPPAADPAPPAAPPAPGAANQAPEARIDLACGSLRRGATLCLNEYARVGAPKTFDATPSRDADGQVVRYEWDLDGDGRYETDTGATPKATRTYTNLDPVTVRLRVTDDRGATDDVEMALKLTEPECQTRVTYKLLGASSPCLRHYRYDAGEGRRRVVTDGRLHSGQGYSGDEYRTTMPLLLNGIGITPGAGRTVSIRVIDWKDDGHVEVDVVGTGALATIRSGEDVVTLAANGLHWRLEGDELADVVVPGGQTLGRLPLVGLSERPRLVLGAGSRFAFMVRMPQQFGAPTSDKPVRVAIGGVRALAASHRGVRRAAAGAAGEGQLHFEVDHAALGPIALDKLSLDYDGDGFWAISADVTLPPPVDARVKADAGILNGAFNYAGADVQFNNQGLNIIGPVFLKRVKFRVEVSPKRSECVPHLGVEPNPDHDPMATGVQTVPGVPAEPKTIDYGVPTFALCGEAALVVGPTVAGVSALRVDAGMGLALYDDRPSVFRMFGAMRLVDILLGEAELEVHGDGYIAVEGHAEWGPKDLATLKGDLKVEMLGDQFNAHGRVAACLEFVDWCVAGARAVVSNKGAAACLRIDVGVDTWEPGIGWRWGDSPTLYFAGCELGPYKNRIRRSAARAAAAPGGEDAVELEAGLPGAAIAIAGADAPPKVTLVGPHGERFTTPDGLEPVQDGRFFVLKDPRNHVTQIAIVKPAGGTWRIVAEPGSSPITSVKTADGVDRPEVKAKVVTRGGARFVEYDVERREGQTVTFAERGATAGAILGRAKGAHGRLRFTPADGRAERRRIVAIVEQDGVPSAQVAVASYRAPAARRPARPRGVRVTRQGTRVQVGWAADGAPSHVVTVALSDGRRVVRRVDRARRLVLGDVGRGVRATASVRAVGRNGLLGAGRSARLAARPAARR
jgi:PKD repeat protein